MERLEEAPPRGASAPSGERPGGAGGHWVPARLRALPLHPAPTGPDGTRCGKVPGTPAGQPRADGSPVRGPPASLSPQHPHGRVLTEAAVVVAGAVHRAVGEDLKVEACAAVELAAPQDPLQVGEVCGRAALQLPLDLAQALVQETRGVS